MFSNVKPIALERFCQSILDEACKESSDKSKSAHERYLSIFKLIDHKDKMIQDAFIDNGRSTALLKLMLIYSYGVISEDEFAQFSEGTRRRVLPDMDKPEENNE